MGIPPLKHVIDAGGSVTGVAVQHQNLAQGFINPNIVTNDYEVRNGSIVRGMEIQLDIQPDITATGAQPAFFDWYIGFNIANAQTMPSPDAVGGSDLAPQVFHQEGCLLRLPTAANQPVIDKYSWRAHVAIPRSWGRLNNDDNISLYFKSGSAITYWWKIRAIYKEIYP